MGKPQGLNPNGVKISKRKKRRNKLGNDLKNKVIVENTKPKLNEMLLSMEIEGILQHYYGNVTSSIRSDAWLLLKDLVIKMFPRDDNLKILGNIARTGNLRVVNAPLSYGFDNNFPLYTNNNRDSYGRSCYTNIFGHLDSFDHSSRNNVFSPNSGVANNFSTGKNIEGFNFSTTRAFSNNYEKKGIPSPIDSQIMTYPPAVRTNNTANSISKNISGNINMASNFIGNLKIKSVLELNSEIAITHNSSIPKKGHKDADIISYKLNKNIVDTNVKVNTSTKNLSNKFQVESKINKNKKKANTCPLKKLSIVPTTTKSEASSCATQISSEVIEIFSSDSETENIPKTKGKENQNNSKQNVINTPGLKYYHCIPDRLGASQTQQGITEKRLNKKTNEQPQNKPEEQKNIKDQLESNTQQKNKKEYQPKNDTEKQSTHNTEDQSKSIKVVQNKNNTIEQPKSKTVEPSKNNTVEQPKNITEEKLKNSTVEQTKSNTVEKQKNKTVEQPKSNTLKQHKNTTEAQPKNKIEEQPNNSAVEQPKSNRVEQLKNNIVEQPKNMAENQLINITLEKPKSNTVEQHKNNTEAQPKPINNTVDQPKNNTVEQPKINTGEQPKNSTEEQLNNSAVEQPKSNTVEQQKNDTVAKDNTGEQPKKSTEIEFNNGAKVQPKKKTFEDIQNLCFPQNTLSNSAKKIVLDAPLDFKPNTKQINIAKALQIISIDTVNERIDQHSNDDNPVKKVIRHGSNVSANRGQIHVTIPPKRKRIDSSTSTDCEKTVDNPPKRVMLDMPKLSVNGEQTFEAVVNPFEIVGINSPNSGVNCDKILVANHPMVVQLDTSKLSDQRIALADMTKVSVNSEETNVTNTSEVVKLDTLNVSSNINFFKKVIPDNSNISANRGQIRVANPPKKLLINSRNADLRRTNLATKKVDLGTTAACIVNSQTNVTNSPKSVLLKPTHVLINGKNHKSIDSNLPIKLELDIPLKKNLAIAPQKVQLNNTNKHPDKVNIPGTSSMHPNFTIQTFKTIDVPYLNMHSYKCEPNSTLNAKERKLVDIAIFRISSAPIYENLEENQKLVFIDCIINLLAKSLNVTKNNNILNSGKVTKNERNQNSLSKEYQSFNKKIKEKINLTSLRIEKALKLDGNLDFGNGLDSVSHRVIPQIYEGANKELNRMIEIREWRAKDPRRKFQLQN